MKVVLDEGAFAPERAHETDAGMDLKSPMPFIIPAHGSVVIDTGVHVELPKGHAGLVVSKSGLNVKHNITSTGLIDEPFQGSIRIKLYNHGNSNYTINRGDKISQLVVVPVVYESVEVVEGFDHVTDRGEKGFGSTGR